VLARLATVVAYGLDKNGLLAIEVDDTNKQLAVKIANAYIENLSAIATQMSTAYSRKNRAFLEEELAKHEATLSHEEHQMVDSELGKGSGSLPLISTTGSADTQLSTAYNDLLQRKEQTLINVQAMDKTIESMVRTTGMAIKTGSDLPADIPVAMESRSRLRQLEMQVAYAKATEGPDNPDYNTLNDALQSARSEVNSEIQREAMAMKEGISPSLAMMYANRAGLQAEYDGLADASKRMDAVLRSLPESEMEEGQVQTDVRIETAMVQNLTEEVERAKLAEERDTPTFVVVDSPEIPETPYAPQRTIITAISLIAGFLVGCAWAVIASLPRGSLSLLASESEE